MVVICAWCGNKISGSSESGQSVSHGICNECAVAHFSSFPVNLEEILDQFSTPILVVGSDGNIETANQTALDALGKDRGEIKHMPGGNVFGCIHSVKPEGCGKTIHCKSCTIRRTVEQVMATGQNQYRIPATLKVMDSVAERDIVCTITAEKVGDFVILTVEDFTGFHEPGKILL